MIIRHGSSFKNKSKTVFDSDLKSIFYKKKHAFSSGTISMAASGSLKIGEFSNSQFFVVMLEYVNVINSKFIISGEDGMLLSYSNFSGFLNDVIFVR